MQGQRLEIVHQAGPVYAVREWPQSPLSSNGPGRTGSTLRILEQVGPPACWSELASNRRGPKGASGRAPELGRGDEVDRWSVLRTISVMFITLLPGLS